MDEKLVRMALKSIDVGQTTRTRFLLRKALGEETRDDLELHSEHVLKNSKFRGEKYKKCVGNSCELSSRNRTEENFERKLENTSCPMPLEGNEPDREYYF